MHPGQVRQLEEQLEAAITLVLERHFPGPPVMARTRHLMAKAAVTVLEAVAVKPERDAPGTRTVDRRPDTLLSTAGGHAHWWRMEHAS